MRSLWISLTGARSRRGSPQPQVRSGADEAGPEVRAGAIDLALETHSRLAPPLPSPPDAEPLYTRLDVAARSATGGRRELWSEPDGPRRTALDTSETLASRCLRRRLN